VLVTRSSLIEETDMQTVRKLALASVFALPLAVTAMTAAADDIVDTAIAAGSFETLVAAVQAADLVDVLKGEGPFTVFAPTDEAFAALPEGTVESLLLPENKDMLVSILTYHVVPGEVMAKDAEGATVDLETVQGASVTVDGTGETVTVNGANVITADIATDNGVIHVIDAVIMPPA
jgi:uncharacterized surface protein with fasciclin (FAS1) repeats